jgi:murein DD-endopeptidase MepM/ murein hydrolase activator NlpD
LKQAVSREREASRPGEASLSSESKEAGGWLSALAWLAALALVVFAVYLGWKFITNQPAASSEPPAAVPQFTAPEIKQSQINVSLPAFAPVWEESSITRRTDVHTIIPTRPREEVRDYTVDTGDSLFEIAKAFNIKPETVLWANYDLLNDNPDLVSVGMELKIPPANGVLYQWKEGDTIQSVAGQFEAKPEEILNWAGNDLDLIDPQVEPGTLVMVPNGHREFRQWLIPTIPRGKAGVSKDLYGAGTCEGGYDGAYGTGTFIYPIGQHGLSGNDYWSGHLGLDFGAGDGTPIYAADSGVVVFSGWATGGYGNMVMIDHGNGYQTLYGHMSGVAVSCGRSVSQGTTIGYAGSTGNSTGTHLHFEVRYQGGFVNPWYVLPAP